MASSIRSQISLKNGEYERSESPEAVVKHPLQNRWTLWFFKNENGRAWEENQKSIITVSCIGTNIEWNCIGKFIVKVHSDQSYKRSTITD